MVHIRVLAFSDKSSDPLIALARDYLRRCRGAFQAELLLEKPARRKKGDSDDKARRTEADRLLSSSERHHRIALDTGGQRHTSSGFSSALQDRLGRGRPVAFLIGGATGLHPSLTAASDESWSLSPLTFAHRLAVLVVCEQIYRAQEIARGGPYAK